MAAGDAVSGITTITAGATYDIKPGAGVEWIIRNIKVSGSGGTFTISDYNGTTLNTYDSGNCPAARIGVEEALTNAYWIQVKNTGTGSIVLSYNGTQTK